MAYRVCLLKKRVRTALKELTVKNKKMNQAPTPANIYSGAVGKIYCNVTGSAIRKITPCIVVNSKTNNAILRWLLRKNFPTKRGSALGLPVSTKRYNSKPNATKPKALAPSQTKLTVGVNVNNCTNRNGSAIKNVKRPTSISKRRRL